MVRSADWIFLKIPTVRFFPPWFFFDLFFTIAKRWDKALLCKSWFFLLKLHDLCDLVLLQIHVQLQHSMIQTTMNKLGDKICKMCLSYKDFLHKHVVAVTLTSGRWNTIQWSVCKICRFSGTIHLHLICPLCMASLDSILQ
jgi:hypothetical protein